VHCVTGNIHASYVAIYYLMKYEGYMDDENESLEDDEFSYEKTDLSGNLFYRLFLKNNYNNILFSFLQMILKDDETIHLFHTIIMRITNICKEAAMETIQNLSFSTLKKLYLIMKNYQTILHLEDDFIENIEKIIKERENLEKELDEYIILNPLLDDLFENNLYKLTVNGFTYVVPLWHSYLVYDNSGCDIHVNCFPILPKNIEIDENNNLFVDVNYKISDIWDKETLDIPIGKNILPITVGEIKLKKEQTFLLFGSGISKINTKDVYDISKKSNIYINLFLDL
jgi:hypothetical protein